MLACSRRRNASARSAKHLPFTSRVRFRCGFDSAALARASAGVWRTHRTTRTQPALVPAALFCAQQQALDTSTHVYVAGRPSCSFLCRRRGGDDSTRRLSLSACSRARANGRACKRRVPCPREQMRVRCWQVPSYHLAAPRSERAVPAACEGWLVSSLRPRLWPWTQGFLQTEHLRTNRVSAREHALDSSDDASLAGTHAS